MANLRLRRLKIEKFRNVAPGTELVFRDGMNVVLGRNGTGKTTMLQLIAMVTSSNFEALVEDEFDLAYELFLFGLRFHVEFANRSLSAHRRRGIRKRARKWWSFRVSILTGDGGEVVIIESTPEGARALVELGRTRPTLVRDPFGDASPMKQAMGVLELLDEAGAVVVDGLTEFCVRAFDPQSEVSQQGGRYDEGLGSFGALVSGYGFLSVNDAKDALGLLFYFTAEQDDEREDWVSSVFAPPELEAVALRRIRASGAADITLNEADLPFLRRALDLIGGREAKMILKLQTEESPEDGGDATFGDFEFLITMEDGSVFRHDYLSYGQKRLLSFLYYAAANPDIIIADELVNGLHHEWIEACLDEVKDRQCFFTSQNPLLLDYLSFDSVEEVERTFLLCDRRKEGARAQLMWQHMDGDSAESFFRAYRAGVQHVSEILRTKGLW